jgi:hypothetical protein
MDEHKAAKALALIEQHGEVILNGLSAHYAEYGANARGKAALEALRELVAPEKVTITVSATAPTLPSALHPHDTRDV